MKTRTRLRVLLAGGCLLVGSVGSGAEAPRPPRTIAGVPFDHRNVGSGIASDDLDHGAASARLRLTRVWAGAESLNSHFGPGWSDDNWIRLGLVDQEVVLIRRGGLGWRTAYRKSETLFEGSDGLRIERTEKGWSAQMLQGIALTFDVDGRLLSLKPGTAAPYRYTYDGRGLLATVGTSSENQLRYHYDKAGQRVVRVDGPERLQVDYRYDDTGKLAAVTTSTRTTTEYRYATDGQLASASDQFGTRWKADEARRVAAESGRAAGPAGGVDLAAMPQSQDVSYTHDGEGKVQAITSPEGTTTCKYDNFGRIISLQHGSGPATRFEFNNLDLPT
ncbi:MAG: hypothetical protein LC642_01215, partial [Verrucomicrobiaceae bacterium]|nr:hypothetical protein [Verrucomicrobiaceae bacterium]